VVVLGLADSPELRQALERSDSMVLIFEPDERRLASFLDKTSLTRLNRNGVFCFSGDPYSHDPPLQDMLPRAMFQTGCPAFFMTERIGKHFGQWAGQVIEYIEILHYRHYLYLLSGQRLKRSQPIRAICRDISFDQQLHAYENLGDLVTRPDISHLTGKLEGQTALLVAAGPDLDSKMEYIRRNRERAVVISVNNALKPLLEAGIEPHFTVINDVSIGSGKVFRQIPATRDTILVGHCLSDLGRDRFAHKYLFGEFLPEVFGEMEELRLHGSVISAAFSLAELLGCSRCVFIGGQLASADPWNLSYARGVVDMLTVSPKPALINRHPQLYPVTTPFGEQMYTTPNFRDAALWLTEVIRLSGIECVNTSESSILYGEGIRFDAAPELPEADFSGPLSLLGGQWSVKENLARAIAYMEGEKARWKRLLALADTLKRDSGEVFSARGMAILEMLDQENVTYLIEHFGEFRTRVFHRLVFEGDAASREQGLRMYFSHLREMATLFLGELERQGLLFADLAEG